ncbi:MAG: radical SAM protein [Ruminococcus sp.]|nr:radical SAM protein [Ruminococcus sp.]
MKHLNELYRHCTLCPRECGADRYNAKGYCGEGAAVRIARAELHFWEEPCLSLKGGSGTVFFSGCNLGCCYCQNHQISAGHMGFELTVRQLADTFLRLRDKGAENIDLVTPTHFVPSIIEALDLLGDSLRLPVIYNCGGYEKPETLELLRGYVDIFLPDMKYFDSSLSLKLSGAGDYFEKSLASLHKMTDIAGKPRYDSDGKLIGGVIVRHLVLPHYRKDSIAIIKRLAQEFAPDEILISLMSQFTPEFRAAENGLDRRTTTFEYKSVLEAVEKAGFDGFIQDRDSAQSEYIPEFFDHLYFNLPNTQNKL